MGFEYTLEKFLLNIFFIMFPLIFYQFIINEKMKQRTIVRDVLSFLLFGIPIVLCMAFPLLEQNGSTFDLRMIPLILGCFYANFRTSCMLLLTLIGVRFMFGGYGAYLNLCTSTILFIVTISCFKTYHSFSLAKKIIISCILTLTCRIMVTLSSNLIIGSSYTLVYEIELCFVQSLFMGLIIYIIESVTKNMELRRELIASEKMKVVSVIAASVAHEIRNPLTAVRGFLQLFRTELTTDKRLMYIQVSLEELDRAQQIISDYLSLAKPHPDHIEKLYMKEEINYISHVLSSYANINNVNIHIGSELNLCLLGDRQKFRQSIINIAKNGIEAMEEKGGVLTISVLEHKNNIILLINDKGTGMTNDQINRLGTPYFSNKEKGTGLGTMVAFSIIKNINGKIDVKSTVGEGTEYRITFPKSY